MIIIIMIIIIIIQTDAIIMIIMIIIVVWSQIRVQSPWLTGHYTECMNRIRVYDERG